ncbi:MAG: hypothetical protein GEV03_01385 [Streptosporangiales bacterium]|nr:hypothetical protein [Streptosporangiales bacterium]
MTLLADRPAAGDGDATRVPRPLGVAGLVAAIWSAGIGLVTVTLVTLIGWIAAPHQSLGAGLESVLRTALQFWLVSHHAGFALPDGRVGLLPIGLILIPGLVVFRAGEWLARLAEVPRLQRVGYAALAIACPYALLGGTLAQVAGNSVMRPSVWQSLLGCFLVAFVAGGAGVARRLTSWRQLLALLPERPRSLVVGTLAACAFLVMSGALLAAGSLAFHITRAQEIAEGLSPGIVGGLLLLLLQIAFVPNAVIWGMAYAVGPGFAVGGGTIVAPTGNFLGPMPSFPLLAAVPEPGPAPVASLVALAAPFLAGAVGGILTMRTAPTLNGEAAPGWGLVCGVCTGAVAAALAALSGGPFGDGRLAAVGPSPWQVGMITALEVGVAAAVAAWVTNFWLLRRTPPAAAAEEESFR